MQQTSNQAKNYNRIQHQDVLPKQRYMNLFPRTFTTGDEERKKKKYVFTYNVQRSTDEACHPHRLKESMFRFCWLHNREPPLSVLEEHRIVFPFCVRMWEKRRDKKRVLKIENEEESLIFLFFSATFRIVYLIRLSLIFWSLWHCPQKNTKKTHWIF